MDSLLPVVGSDLLVPLVSGGSARYVNLDYAASAPCLAAVADALATALPWYSSVHRGAGFASAVTTAAYAEARETVRAFVGARPDDTLVFTRNTTDALNLLAACLPGDTTVISFASEHHANLLPWQRGRHVCLPVPRSVEEALSQVEAALAAVTTAHALVAVTGASNVTGELWPVAELARIAHRHGARIAVDAAQLAPHRAIDLATLGVDYLAFSGHKLYAPFGGGVLVGRADWLDAAEPWLAGGGAVRHVTVEHTEWALGAARHEGGTPNVLGAVTLAAACKALSAIGFETVEAHERALVERLLAGLRALPEVRVLSLFGADSPRIGVVAFVVDGWDHGRLAAALSAEHGIGVRDGAFCAHPLVEALLSPATTGRTGAVRASLGVGSSAGDVDRLVGALATLLRNGSRARYEVDAGRVVPASDPRPLPAFVGRPARRPAPTCQSLV